MSDSYIDISRPLREGMAAWPGSRGFRSHIETSIQRGDEANGSAIEMDVHLGTHVDAPLHFVDGGAAIEEVGLDPFVGPAFVAELLHADEIGARELDGADIPDDVTRLLLRTRNSLDDQFVDGTFVADFAALSLDGARWVVERGLTLVGIDYMSIQRYADSFDTHRVILGAGVCILEGLDLRSAEPGPYELVCLPMYLQGLEAAPARAVLRREHT